MSISELKSILNLYHKNSKNLTRTPKPKEYKELKQRKPNLFFAPFDMQQVELLMLAKDQVFDADIITQARLYNEYFGSGLSSILFQEIREKRALAYSCASWYSQPTKKDENYYVKAYIGTQADKLEEATEAMHTILNNMPKATVQFENTKESLQKSIESNRNNGSNIYWYYERLKKLDISYDINKTVYKQLKDIQFEDLSSFFDKHIKGQTYSTCIIGKKENVNFSKMSKFGTIKNISLKDLFGY